jgi:hypothetical protein
MILKMNRQVQRGYEDFNKKSIKLRIDVIRSGNLKTRHNLFGARDVNGAALAGQKWGAADPFPRSCQFHKDCWEGLKVSHPVKGSYLLIMLS